MADDTPPLEGMTVSSLLALEAGIVQEFKRRGLVRTNNKPLADIAERIVLQARGGILEANSTRSHDVTTSAGRTIQVKAMGPRAAGETAVFGMFRSFDFDSAVVIRFLAPNFDIEFAREVLPDAIHESVRFSSHVNAWLPSLRWVRTAGVDVTAEMVEAYRALDRKGMKVADGD